MRNYSSKNNKKVVRYNSPTSFRLKKSQAVKRAKTAPPYHPPERGLHSPQT